MGKRRRRRVSSDTWWNQSTGGMKHWGIVAVAVICVAGIIYGASVAAQRPDASASWTPPPKVSASPTPTPTAMPIALFIGDSYTAGTGATKESLRWSSLVAEASDLREENYGRGGTGFVSTAGKDGCGLEFCASYPEMVEQAQNAKIAPALVFVAGGQNDTDEWLDPEQHEAVLDAITSTYTSARNAFPDARLIAVGPSFLGRSADWQNDFDDAVRSAADAAGAEYISLLSPPVLGDSALELGDGAHVNDLGHRAIADRVLTLSF